MLIVSEKQVEAIAYELSERFFKRVGGGNSLAEVDDLAAFLAAEIVAWLRSKGHLRPENAPE